MSNGYGQSRSPLGFAMLKTSGDTLFKRFGDILLADQICGMCRGPSCLNAISLLKADGKSLGTLFPFLLHWEAGNTLDTEVLFFWRLALWQS